MPHVVFVTFKNNNVKNKKRLNVNNRFESGFVFLPSPSAGAERV